MLTSGRAEFSCQADWKQGERSAGFGGPIKWRVSGR